MGLKKMLLRKDPISHRTDCERMIKMMLSMDYIVNLEDVHEAYTEYSDMYAAGWLFIPDDDDELKLVCESLISEYFYEDESWAEAYDRASNY